MFSLSNLSIFLLAALILLLTPGPAVLYIVARSLDQGRLAGFVSVLSIEVGNFVHVLAATLGLSAILVSSALAFSVVKYLGAAYLIYLGVRRLFARETVHQPSTFQRQSLRRIFRQGVLVAILNPKTALFFFAFLPQFVDASKSSITLQLLTLGCLFVIMAIVTDSLYALLAGTFGQWLKGTRSFLRIERYLVGTVYIALGVMAAFTDNKRH
ncbi:MAG: LysE family translocator [Deltaproteobacteria bacterium]|jgi:threonine/homoserine/homoserine lactone efflux protein|nr:LysE family translocator [Deltaproteobacteria bacterium]